MLSRTRNTVVILIKNLAAIMLFVAFLVLGCSLPLFAQNPPHITGTSKNLDDQKVVLTPEEQAWLRAHPEIQLGYLVADRPRR